MKTLLTPILVLVMAAASYADVIVSAEYSTPAPGFKAATLTFNTDDGSLITAFDFDQAYSLGIYGPLNQVLAAGTIPTPDETYKAFLTPEQWALDSHFLFVASNDVIPIAGTLQESASSMHIIAGIPSEDWASQYTFAYIVCPIDSWFDVFLAAEVADSNNNKSYVTWTPEPASLSLLAVASLVLARRRSLHA